MRTIRFLCSSLILHPFICLLFAIPVHAGPGDVDLSFDPNPNGRINSSAVRPDGKILIGGQFTTLHGITRNYLANLNADGTLNSGFDLNVIGGDFVGGYEVGIDTALEQMDGKIVIGGVFTNLGGVTRNFLARLNADRTLDVTFDPSIAARLGAVRFVLNPAIQKDGKIVIVGYFTAVGGTTRNYIARLNADGTLDAGFNPDADGIVRATAVQPDGKIVIGGQFISVGGTVRNRLARLNADGTLDTKFDPAVFGDGGAGVFCIAEQADGKLVIGGSFTTVAGRTRNNIARLNPDGALDAGFHPDTSSTSFPFLSHVNTIAVQADGKIIIGGWFTTLGGLARNRIARVHADGTLDLGFNPDANDRVVNATVLADGKIVVSGDFNRIGGVARNYVARLENDTATQSLTVSSASRIEWFRGGASPEAQHVAFELSTDGGANWIPLGWGSRISGGWELAGINLPTSGSVRARARVSGGIWNGSSGLLETVASFSLPQNTRPTVTNPIADFAVNEDTPSTVINLTTAFTDAETVPASLAYSVQDNTDMALVQPTITPNANLTLAYTPNQFGVSTVTVRATDAGGLFAEDTFLVIVNAVNDAPVVMLPSNVIVTEDSGPRSLSSFLTFTPGLANESSQSLVGYTVSGDNTGLFDALPVIDNAGTLSFTPAANGNGSASVTVIAQDDGGTANGGVDRSTNTFTIAVTPVNDEPAVSFATNNVVVWENSGTNSLKGFASFAPGPANESGQTLAAYTVSNNNPTLFNGPLTLDNTGTLTFTLATNATGVATVSVVVQDDGGTANGGVDKSTNSFTLTVAPLPRLTDMIWFGNGAFQFGFTNLSGVPFTALATTNLTLPSSDWTVLGPAMEIFPGQFQFTDTSATNFAYRFYQIRSP